MCNEIWETIPNFDGYEVSNLGRVRSFKQSRKGHVLKPRPFFKGNDYLGVSLCLNGKVEVRLVHRLVAEAFIPNPLNKPMVNHINGIKTDNRVENLEWVTVSENHCHAYAIGLRNARGENNGQSKLTNEQVRYIRENSKHLTQVQLAVMFNVGATTIHNVQTGKSYQDAGGTVREARACKHTPRVPDNVRSEIRRLYKYGVKGCGSTSLARRFGIGETAVWRIVHEAD